MVDEMKNIPPLINAFDRIRHNIFLKKDLLTEIQERSADEGFQRVRKVSRLSFLEPSFEERAEIGISYFRMIKIIILTEQCA